MFGPVLVVKTFSTEEQVLVFSCPFFYFFIKIKNNLHRRAGFIFGPLYGVFPLPPRFISSSFFPFFKALALANDSSFGLAAAVLSKDEVRAMRMVRGNFFSKVLVQ